MDDSGNIRYFNDGEEIPERFVELKNGDVLKHTTHDRYFLIISISESEIKCRPIANEYAKGLIAKRKIEALESGL